MKAKPLYLIIMVLVVVLLLSVSKCSYNKTIHNKNLEALTDTLITFKNKIGTQTASIKTLRYNKQQLQNNLLEKDAELATLAKQFTRINSVIKYKTVVKLDTLRVVYHDTIPSVFTRIGTVKEPFYNFTYTSTQNGFLIGSISIPNTATVITGTKRTWFLGAETVTTDVTNSNPYITVTGITAAEVVVPNPWYKKWYVWFAAGIAGGMFLSK
jgi:hypothetical protein